ncbi:GNAT family N-acetyltransferase [Roseovarius aquimarinus]|uniref:GNAT family N-acetyltransferase n=1 Tax=Roseovarius aquimarinus TaxID=1229156 RepID=A0ABW7I3S3_9RHOB
MRSKPAPTAFDIRRLWSADSTILIEHFQRLDTQTRHMRFGGPVSDSFVTDYAAQALSIDSVIFGAFPDGGLRGVAELRGILGMWPKQAEIALLVEPDWQDGGIGDALLGRVIAAAQNRGINKVHMLCLRENARMQSLARKHEAELIFYIGDVEATLQPPWPTPMSVFEEVYGDPHGYFRAVFPLGPWLPRRSE